MTIANANISKNDLNKNNIKNISDKKKTIIASKSFLMNP